MDWGDCRVNLDVTLTVHVSDAVKTVGEQGLKIPGTPMEVDPGSMYMVLKEAKFGPFFHF